MSDGRPDGVAARRPWAASVPPALLVAMVIMVASEATIDLLRTHVITRRPFSSAGWIYGFVRDGSLLLSTGVAFATAALLVAGFGELARRSAPGPARTLLRIGQTAQLVMLAVLAAGVYANHSFAWATDPGKLEVAQSFWRWSARVQLAAALVASATLIAAGWRRPGVRLLALPLLAATALYAPSQWLWELIRFHAPDRGEHWLQAAIGSGVRVAYAATLLAVVAAVGRTLPPAPAERARAGEGLHRVGSALVARVVIAVLVAVTTVMAVGAQSAGLVKLSATVYPLALLVTSIALVTGMLQAAGFSAAGAPRKRLYVAAALTTVALVVDGLRALALYTVVRLRGSELTYEREHFERAATALPYLSPTIAVAGLVCLLAAVAWLRREAADARVPEGAVAGAVTSVVLFSLVAVLVMRWIQSGEVRSAGAAVMLTLMAAGATIVAQLAVARVCHGVGAAMGEAPALPTAVIAER